MPATCAASIPANRAVLFSPPHGASAGQLLISEFRLRGPGGANDEFVEIYNNSDGASPSAADGSAGYALVASSTTALNVGARDRVHHPERDDHPGARSLPLRQLGRLLARRLPGRQRHDRHGRRHLHDGHPRQRRHRALQHQRSPANFTLAEPARRRRLHGRGQHALQGRRRLSGAEPRSTSTTPSRGRLPGGCTGSSGGRELQRVSL